MPCALLTGMILDRFSILPGVSIALPPKCRNGAFAWRMVPIMPIFVRLFFHVAMFAALGAAVLASQPGPAPVIIEGQADYILVEKSIRRMVLIRQGEVIAMFRISLGGAPVGDKERQGDNRTPEGIYTIVSKNSDSAFHLSLMTSYPDAEDRRAAAARGVSPGGDIAIHGLPNRFGDEYAAYFRANDWTLGCIAVTNAEIEAIYDAVPIGTVIEIRP